MASKSIKPLVITKDNGSKFTIDYGVLRRAHLTLRALNHPIRKQMLEIMESKKKVNVTEIYGKLKLEQSVASQHLAILRRAGVAKASREGKFIWYTADKKRLEEINNLIQDLAQDE
ncbi:MAG: metalloregulator ArsR/SmtB family transcription factor [Chitinophagales bacterium]|nr:metalloregulator ArsR/SmtB family transcription factor [Chitinophagales bacterium]MDW8418271.1 metalloregulator ArsR/SmtB family transcription factor [Chitinophagales bacterium]